MNQHTLRQRLVPQIGDEGQARIARSIASVTTSGLEGKIAARYLAYAGFAELHVASIAAQTDARQSAPTHATSIDALLIGCDRAVIDIARGASCALDQIRRAAKGKP